MFLNPQISEIISEINVKHSSQFEAARELSSIAHRAMSVANNPVNPRELILVLLNVRALTSFQGMVILLERGMPSEARVLLRMLLEVAFKLEAIAKNPELGGRYALQDKLHQKKRIYKFGLLNHEITSEADRLYLKSLLPQLNKDLENISDITTEQFAKAAGRIDLYHSAYSVLSDSVHTNVRDLESLIVENRDAELESIIYGPSDTDIREHLLSGCEYLLLCLRATYSVVEIGSSNVEEIDQIDRLIKTLILKTAVKSQNSPRGQS
jgi:hypothetical protein